jgi:hypothetical protein
MRPVANTTNRRDFAEKKEFNIYAAGIKELVVSDRFL